MSFLTFGTFMSVDMYMPPGNYKYILYRLALLICYFSHIDVRKLNFST